MGGFAISPVMQGILQGATLAMQIRNQALIRERERRLAAAQDQEMQLRDIQTQEMLNRSGRPVVGGTVEDSTTAVVPGGMPGLPDSTISAAITRRPDAARHVKYKTRSGDTIERELYSEQEQQQKAIEQFQIKKAIEDQMKQVVVPGALSEQFGFAGMIDPQVLTALTTVRGMQARGTENAASRQSRETIAEADRKARLEAVNAQLAGANERTAATNRTRLEAARIRESGLSARDGGKDTQREVKAVAGQKLRLRAQELRLETIEKKHADERTKLGDILTRGKIRQGSKERTLGPEERVKYQSLYKNADDAYKQVLTQKQLIQEQRQALMESQPDALPTLAVPVTGAAAEWQNFIKSRK